jgi:hypothetical protein
MKAAINSDEPEESLLTAKDAWQDYQSLKIALAEEGTGPAAQQWLELPPGVWALVRELVAAGVCQDEREVITRAVEAFFVAVSPQHARRYQVLRDARAKYE